nr:MAG TPA: hypothetical protein [Caudoviricetes sp.]
MCKNYINALVFIFKVNSVLSANIVSNNKIL